jgi:D-alanyl-D-alanine dipeptidase
MTIPRAARICLVAGGLLLCAAQGQARQRVAEPQLDSARARVLRAITPDPHAALPAAAPPSWLAYIGEYGSVHDPLVILENNGTLAALFNGVSLQELREVAADTFAFVSDSQRVVFVRSPRTGPAAAVLLPNARLERRPIGPADGRTFRITPVRPIEELRSVAHAASPPVESGDFLAADLVELNTLDTTIHYDIRYATRNNFMGAVFYTEPHALLQRPAAEAVARVARRLAGYGYGLLILDAYRPWYVTKMFWDATPDSLKQFVADPASGSRHNRGAAVDLSLYDLRTGRPVVAVSGYDEFSPRAFPDYAGGTTRQRWFRAVLRDAMEAQGFTVYSAEWWHFDYRDWRHYRIGNSDFSERPPSPRSLR